MSTRDDPPDEPPAKRQKLQPDIQRSPDFWFKRGDLVLVASQQMAYRVHADVLARQSNVFRNLLDADDAPRPEVEDTMAGCPVMHLTDAPADLDTFLGLIYDGFQYQRREVRWATVRVMLLLGGKYGMPEMREEGLGHLRVWYAEDIDVWDARDATFFAHETDHLSVASITRTLFKPKLHAAVLYHCSTLSPAVLVDGDPATGCPPLARDDHVRMLEFLQNAARVWRRFQFGAWVTECEECAIDESAFREQLDEHVRSRIDWSTTTFLDRSEWEPLTKSLGKLTCEECLKPNYETPLRDMRQSCRSELPRYFGYLALPRSDTRDRDQSPPFCVYI